MKRKLALALALVMGFSVNAFAAGEGEGTTNEVKTGGATAAVTTELKSPTISVVLPTTMKFAIDPAEVISSKVVANSNYYSSYGYVMANHSDVDVIVTVLASAASSTATFVSETSVNVSNFDVKTKHLFMQLVPFATVKTVSSMGALSGGAPTYVLLNNLRPTLDGGDNTRTDAKMTFKLKQAQFNADGTFKDLAATNLGVAGFALGGRVNPAAAWQTSDINLKVKYEVTAIGTGMYNAATLRTGTLNLISAENASGGKYIKPAAFTKTTDLTVGATAADGVSGTFTLTNAELNGLAAATTAITYVKIINTTTNQVVFDKLPAAPVAVALDGTGATAGLKIVATKLTGFSAGDGYSMMVEFTNGARQTVTGTVQ